MPPLLEADETLAGALVKRINTEEAMKLLSKILLGIFMVLFSACVGLFLALAHPTYACELPKRIENILMISVGAICFLFLASVIFYGYMNDDSCE